MAYTRASDELRSVIERWFGGLNVSLPVDFLYSRGYVLETPRCFWRKPTPSHHMCYEEFVCLSFLVNEWKHDFDIRNIKPRDNNVVSTVERWFGPERINQMQQPVFFLVSRGYFPVHDYTVWFPPTPSHNICYEEGVCLKFLNLVCGAELIILELKRG